MYFDFKSLSDEEVKNIVLNGTERFKIIYRFNIFCDYHHAIIKDNITGHFYNPHYYYYENENVFVLNHIPKFDEYEIKLYERYFHKSLDEIVWDENCNWKRLKNWTGKKEK